MMEERANIAEEEMDAQFTVVKRKKNCSGSPPPSPRKQVKMGPADIPTTNQFSALQSETSLQHDMDSAEAAPSAPAKRTKIPPVIISNLKTHKELNDLLTNLCQESYTIKPRALNAKVTLTSINDYLSVTSALKKQGLEHYTFPLERIQTQRFVIRGLPANASTTDISDQLASDGFPVRSVTQLTSPADKQKKYPLFVVALTATDGKAKDLSTITRLCNCKVSTEAPRGKRGPTMCFNCQRLGHTSEFCHQKPRCVRCGGSHIPKECPRDRKAPATCANCGGTHPASYRGCPYLVKARKEAKPPQRRTGHPATPKLVEPARPAPTTNSRPLEPAPGTPGTPARPTSPIPAPRGKERPGTERTTYSDILGNKRPEARTPAPPTPATHTSTNDVDWTQLILKIATLVAEMKIHPIVTTVASLIVGILQSEQVHQHGSKD